MRPLLIEQRHINCFPPSENPQKGLVQVLTGDGKGKTTAAVGSAIRALSHGLKVFVAVFMKSNSPFGEWTLLSRFPGVKIEHFGTGAFCDPSNVKPEERKRAEQAFTAARIALLSGEYDIVVMDEVNVAISFGLIDLADIIKLVEEKPSQAGLILTGRYADTELIKRADLVTEMLNIKHPFDSGEVAREGIEY